MEQPKNVLVFKENYFLDQAGLPAATSTVVFNLFKYLTHELSDKYHLDTMY